MRPADLPPLWIGVHLYQPDLDDRGPHDAEAAVLVIEGEHVIAVTPAAARAGAAPGMRRTSALAQVPEAQCLAHDAVRVQALRTRVALALLHYTPLVAPPDDDILLLEVSASLQLFGGLRRLRRQLQARLRLQGVHARLATAPTPGGARLLAASPGRFGRHALSPASLARRLDRLACRHLPAALPWHDWLAALGCHCLGQLRALPRAGLQQRCGPGLQQALDRAYGTLPEPIASFTPPPRFELGLELASRLSSSAALLAAAHRLVDALCGWLNSQQRSVSSLLLLLAHERGRHARPPTPLRIALGAPAWQPAPILRLLQARLDRLVLAAPVIALTLLARHTEARTTPSNQLFPAPGGTPADRRQLLALLGARLGRERVLQPVPRDDHRPERATHWQPADTPPPAGRAATPPAAADARPFWLLDTPLRLPVRGHRPCYPGPLRLVQGPERIEDGWWDELVRRDYFIAEAEDGRRLWLYREQRGAQAGCWFLHGLFA